MKRFVTVVACGAVLFIGAGSGVQSAGKRLVKVDDLFEIRDVGDPQISPDGDWVAYTVRQPDPKTDKNETDIYMTRWDGSQTIRLTTSKGAETTPRFSPDGRFIAFLSDRDYDEETDQVWLLNRAGGEAERITEFKGGVLDIAWSPDGKKLALVVTDPDPNACDPEKEGGKESCEEKTPKPIVIDRYRFKLDETGYLGKQHDHLFLLDVSTRKSEQITSGQYDDEMPSWSPDGRSIAFVSKRADKDPDRGDNYDVYVLEAKAGASPRRLTTFEGSDDSPEWGTPPAWSPDGKQIAYPLGDLQKYIYYVLPKIAIVPVAGGAPRVLTATLDLGVTMLRWSSDGRSIYGLLEDDGSVHLAKFDAATGKVERILAGPRTVVDYALGKDGRIAVLHTTPDEPPEVFAVQGTTLRPLSKQNQELLSQLRLGRTEQVSVKSKDGTMVTAFVVKPPDYQAGRKYPTILDIHGGPVGQYQQEFTFDWQLFAANGYVVVGPNPRGSSGRGTEFCRAIYADWGNKDGQDVLAAVDYLVEKGIADPNHLGVGGWSYGGILTNYVIAQDTRFKAACSGASISNILAGYGTDQYVVEYDNELGTPWSTTETWIKLSYPFLKANRIKTPTLFLCGESDFNVPLLNSEQMYQALRTQGIDTELVIYPGQYHGIRKPTYLKDRLERYLAWYGKYLKAEGVRAAAGQP
jgi:dipeptidyl aminopeptidase/acylaminoacyl peptidase